VSTELDPERLAVLVHEVRSPVAALGAIAETLRRAGAEDDVWRELSSLAVAACRGIDRIVADASVTSIRPEPIDLTRLVRDVCAAEALAGARVRAVLPPDEVRIEGDPLRLTQALRNLVANAWTHGAGEIVVTLRLDGAGREAVIEVADDGPGVPPGELVRIFDAGVRLDDSEPGSGLGLAVVRAVAEGHGGSARAGTSPGGGAVFTITLPRSGAA
jgi:signal transduction histidine kinase